MLPSLVLVTGAPPCPTPQRPRRRPPPVSARSTSHFRIAKSDVGRGERVATSVSALDAPARREEIARMLAGATITEEARAAARRLIENAG